MKERVDLQGGQCFPWFGGRLAAAIEERVNSFEAVVRIAEESRARMGNPLAYVFAFVDSPEYASVFRVFGIIMSNVAVAVAAISKRTRGTFSVHQVGPHFHPHFHPQLTGRFHSTNINYAPSLRKRKVHKQSYLMYSTSKNIIPAYLLTKVRQSPISPQT